MSKKMINAQNEVDLFNKLYKIGQKVKYYPVLKALDGYKEKSNNFKIGKTTSPAWVLPCGEAVVTTDIMGGGLLLSHIEIIN